jgi:hypothetical protein
MVSQRETDILFYEDTHAWAEQTGHHASFEEPTRFVEVMEQVAEMVQGGGTGDRRSPTSRSGRIECSLEPTMTSGPSMGVPSALSKAVILAEPRSHDRRGCGGRDQHAPR